MKDMTWIPDPEREAKVNAYLEQINHAPYGTILAVLMALCCGFTLMLLVGAF